MDADNKDKEKDNKERPKKEKEHKEAKVAAPPFVKPKPVMDKDFRYLVRIANTDVDGKKQIFIALQKIKGIGMMYANMVCNFAGVDKTKKAGDLTEIEIQKLTDAIMNPIRYNAPEWMLNRRKDYETGIDHHLIGTDVTFTVDNDIKRMKKIRCYKGVRHMQGQPVRGQRTKSNFRKNKGKGLGVKKAKGPSKARAK